MVTLFVRAGTEAYPDAEAHLHDRLSRQVGDIPRDTVVVDNLLPPGVHEQQAGRTVIGGDNSVWEFSAIDAALAHLGPKIRQYTTVNVVTSAFEQLYTAYLDRFTPVELVAIAGQPVCLGHIDCYNQPVRIGAYRSQHWLRTCFLMLPVDVMLALGTFVSARTRQPWFSGSAADPFGAASPLDETYRKYITDWLLGQDIGQGVTWHRSLTLDDASLEVFEQKALAIINEHLLAVRLRASGVSLIDVTWLSTRLRTGTPDWRCPWWEQLAARDRDALHLAVSTDAAPLSA